MNDQDKARGLIVRRLQWKKFADICADVANTLRKSTVITEELTEETALEIEGTCRDIVNSVVFLIEQGNLKKGDKQ